MNFRKILLNAKSDQTAVLFSVGSSYSIICAVDDSYLKGKQFQAGARTCSGSMGVAAKANAPVE